MLCKIRNEKRMLNSKKKLKQDDKNVLMIKSIC